MVFIDETTDNTTDKVLAIVVRYFNSKKFKFEIRLFKLAEPLSCTGEELFNSLKQSFNEKNIKIDQKCIGFASDNTNAMVGQFNSVVSRLK